MAQLAIKGHATRGKEVIEILEMLGGKNIYNLTGTQEIWYILLGSTIKPSEHIFEETGFTLEEFLEKYPYKVGDKVQHKGATSCGSVFEVEKMRWEEDTIKYTLCLFGCNYKSSTLPAEYLQPYKEETMEERKYADLRLDVDQDDKLATEATIEGNKITPPENYLIGKITKVDNGMIVEFVKKKPQYPKTYVECAKILNCFSAVHIDGYKNDLLEKLQELLICRDAYWKIAGDWKFDFDKSCYYLCNEYGSVQKFEGTIDCNAVFTFPTKEMRDVFFENFKDLIEQCKELL